MICSCGLEAVLKRFDTFEYYYCGECKKEVGLEEKPGEGLGDSEEYVWLSKIAGIRACESEEPEGGVKLLTGTKFEHLSEDSAWVKEFRKWQKKNAKVSTTAK